MQTSPAPNDPVLLLTGEHRGKRGLVTGEEVRGGTRLCRVSLEGGEMWKPDTSHGAAGPAATQELWPGWAGHKGALNRTIPGLASARGSLVPPPVDQQEDDERDGPEEYQHESHVAGCFPRRARSHAFN
jgi:hypothetical protein